MRFANRKFIVTGGSSGIGLAVARQLAAEGAQVAVFARDPQKLQDALGTLAGTGHQVISCDVTNEEAVMAACRDLKSGWGGVDGAALCAGAHSVRPLVVSKAVHFEDMFRQNVLSAVNVVRAAQRLLPPTGGSFVLVSSVAGLRGAPGASAYATAKGALLSLVRSLAGELAARRTRINSVVPGVVATPMTEKFLATLPVDQKEAVIKRHPLGLGQPDDVAAAVTFLLSDGARWITGTELVIDGGLSIN
jgi:NAD(P)-dependent dehydrogenase (short-subunit alcohol dehydrogenase family)